MTNNNSYSNLPVSHLTALPSSSRYSHFLSQPQTSLNPSISKSLNPICANPRNPLWNLYPIKSAFYFIGAKAIPGVRIVLCTDLTESSPKQQNKPPMHCKSLPKISGSLHHSSRNQGTTLPHFFALYPD